MGGWVWVCVCVCGWVGVSVCVGVSVWVCVWVGGCVTLFSHLHSITIFFKRIVLFCLSCVCGSCTQFEADRRAFIITINSFGTALNRDDRVKLYPTIGKLHPDGLVKLSKASDYEEVRQVADAYKVGAERLTHLYK